MLVIQRKVKKFEDKLFLMVKKKNHPNWNESQPGEHRATKRFYILIATRAITVIRLQVAVLLRLNHYTSVQGGIITFTAVYTNTDGLTVFILITANISFVIMIGARACVRVNSSQMQKRILF